MSEKTETQSQEYGQSLRFNNNESNFSSNFLDAAKRGDLANIKKYIIEKNIDINCVDDSQRTALHYASSFGHFSIAIFLIQNQACVNLKDKWGETPLHRAAQYNHTNIISLLLYHNANINEQTKSGTTPLHLAAFYGKMESVEYLNFVGADWNIVNKEGKNVYQYAETSTYVSKVKHLPQLKFLSMHCQPKLMNNLTQNEEINNENEEKKEIKEEKETKMCKDHHKVYFEKENIVDDWLYDNGLLHIYEVYLCLFDDYSIRFSFYLPLADIHILLSDICELSCEEINALAHSVQFIELTDLDLEKIDQVMISKIQPYPSLVDCVKAFRRRGKKRTIDQISK